MNTRLKVFVCLIGLVILGSEPKAIGDSGGPVIYTFGNHLDNNESTYALYYTVPSMIQTGVKENLTFYIYLTELSGWKTDSERQILTLTINTPSATVTTQRINSSQFFYQGARWGPFNMTVDLSASQVGLSSGAKTNATVYANLIVYERYNDPRFPALAPDGKTLQVTDVLIAAPGGGSALTGGRLLASIAVGAAVVFILAGVSLVMRKKGQRWGGQKFAFLRSSVNGDHTCADQDGALMGVRVATLLPSTARIEGAIGAVLPGFLSRSDTISAGRSKHRAQAWVGPRGTRE